jgi:hypothetical protein
MSVSYGQIQLHPWSFSLLKLPIAKYHKHIWLLGFIIFGDGSGCEKLQEKYGTGADQSV